MALQDSERRTLLELVHKMGSTEADDTFGIDAIFKRATVSVREALATALLTDNLDSGELEHVLDGLPAQVKADAKLRW